MNPARPRPPQVFVNLGATELPDDFIRDLVFGLRGLGKLNVFIDRDEWFGRDLDHIFTCIEESTIALAIFSSSYPETEWCLDELVKMKERADENKLVVIPVFYDVNKNNVRDLNGEFGDRFEEMIRGYTEYDPLRVQRWETSVTSIARIEPGLTWEARSSHLPLVRDIISELKREPDIIKEAANLGSDSSDSSEDADYTITGRTEMAILEGFSFFTNAGPIPPQYQVFINFRGAKLRDGFVGFLVEALLKEKVNVFIDDHELRGRDLDHLFSRIEESRVAVTIFSKNFTESRWCLDELAKIKECVEQGSLTVIPIFFQMKTNDVKKLKGKFGDNFRDLKSTHCGERETVRKWKEAIFFVSRRPGLSLPRDSRQNNLVRSTVEAVQKVLNDISESERQIVGAQRNHLAARTYEVIRFVVRFLRLFLLFAIALGPYVLISFFSFLLWKVCGEW